MKDVVLTKEEWRRLAAVTPEERERAMKKLQRWIHWQIIHCGFSRECGPFSRGAMGGDAVDVIGEECIEALFCGEWHWKPTRELSSMLIQIAKSKMGRENEAGDTVRIAQLTERTRTSVRDRINDVQERVAVRTDTVYIANRDSVEVKESGQDMLKWWLWIIVGLIVLVISIKVNKC